MTCEETRELLDAFHDGELQPATLAAVETHLRTCASCSASLAAHEALRKKVRSLGRTPAPEALAAKIRKSLAKADSQARGKVLNMRSWSAMAASHFLAIAISGAAVFGLMHGRYVRSFAIQETIDAHVRSLIDERTLMQVASNDSHNVRPWFMGKLDFSPAVAELNKEEFPLLGARVDYLANRYWRPSSMAGASIASTCLWHPRTVALAQQSHRRLATATTCSNGRRRLELSCGVRHRRHRASPVRRAGAGAHSPRDGAIKGLQKITILQARIGHAQHRHGRV